MKKGKIVITDQWYENLDMEMEVVENSDYKIFSYQEKEEKKVMEITEYAEAVICQFAPITKRVIDNMKNCKVIVRYAIGVDNIDVVAATKKGIYVCNVPDYGIDEVSNHAILLLLASIKKIGMITASVKAGQWDYSIAKPVGRTQGKTLGLVGFGKIPQLIAQKMLGFNMDIIAYDPYIKPDIAKDLNVNLVSFDELLKQSDYISINCPLNSQTHHLINDKAISKMKDGVIIINTARGGVICETDLIKGLEQGEIAAVGTDVLEKEPVEMNNPLLKMDNVIITPHFAWYSVEAIQSLQKMVAEEVVRVLDGNKPKNPVNKI